MAAAWPLSCGRCSSASRSNGVDKAHSSRSGYHQQEQTPVVPFPDLSFLGPCPSQMPRLALRRSFSLIVALLPESLQCPRMGQIISTRPIGEAGHLLPTLCVGVTQVSLPPAPWGVGCQLVVSLPIDLCVPSCPREPARVSMCLGNRAPGDTQTLCC